MLSTITGIIFFGAIVINLILGMRQFRLLEQVKNKGFKINPWTSWGAAKDLKKIAGTATDELTKRNAVEILRLKKLSNMALLGATGIIIIIFILNAYFKWQM